MNVHKQTIVKTIGYILFLSLFTLVAFWRVLFFGFWIDDWPLLWASMYNLSYSLQFYNHPGLPLQFLLLTPIFGNNTFAWMIYGLVIKVVVSSLVAIFFNAFTKSKVVGFLAGIFFAVSYAGFEVMADPAANTAGIVAIPLLIALICFVRGIQGEKRSFIYSGIFLFTAFILDPARIVPVFFVLPLLFLFFPKTKSNNLFLRLLLKAYIISGIILIPLFTLWFVKYEYDSQIAHAVIGFFHKPLFILSKLNRFGNLFASIANLFIGFFYSLKQDYMDTGFYQRIFGVGGVGLFFLSLFGFWKFFRQRSKAWGVVGFCILWTFLFYLPNFLSEPRAPMAGPHRYLFISSIGLVGLIAYLLSKIHIRGFMIVVSCVFIVFNIYKANILLSWQATYRSDSVITRLWNTILHDVGRNTTNDIFLFAGQDPWVSQDLNFPSTWAFLVKENMNVTYAKFPVVTTDQKAILTMLCSKTHFKDTRGKPFTKDKVMLSHVYSWEVETPGVLANTSTKTREYFEKLMEEKGCITINK